jgi:hypothetical protein
MRRASPFLHFFPSSAVLAVTLSVTGSALILGCSVLVSPDLSRLEPGADGALPDDVDAGPRTSDDSGPGADLDGGALPGEDGGPMTGVPDTGPECRAGCTDGVLTRCEGGGGAITEECAIGCAPSGDRCGELAPSNVDASLWSGDGESITVSARASFDTSDCVAVSTITQVVSQPGGPEVCVLQVRDLIIERDGVLAVSGSRPLVIMATGDVDIRGAIDVSAEHQRPGPGGSIGGRFDDGSGIGPSGGQPGAHQARFDDGGGGGGGLCGAGGRGGDGGDASGGAGGGRIDLALLQPLRGGSGGGAGNGSFGNVGLGGAGGGAIQISALGRIRLEGAILTGGGGGLGGRAEPAFENFGAGGGGGSGGAILLEAATIELQPGSLLTASGGGGGAAAITGYDGGDGEDGADRIVALGGDGAGARGGDSGGGAMIDGSDGGDDGIRNANGGGGGGGAGCIVVRNAEGTIDASIRAGWSPSAEGVAVATVMTR